MLPSAEELKAAIERRLPGIRVQLEGTSLLVQPQELVRVCRFLVSAPDWCMDYLSDLTAVDDPKENRMDVVYHFYSMSKKHGPITLKVRLDRANPVVASVTPIWRGAEFQEREVYDLFGVRFDGHPDLRRILMWEGFNGHPMRKDYVVEDQDLVEHAPPHG